MTTLRTISGMSVDLDDARLDELRATVRGTVITPQDPSYDEIRAVHNAIFDPTPGLIVQCTGTADVIDAVGLAEELDLLVAVRGGGHSVAGHSSCDGGLLIDLSPMRGVLVDSRTGVTTVQGGATWGDVDRETQAFGRAVPGGIISTTGVGGLTTGGGIGWLHRAFGLACDSLLSAEIVTADGRVVRAAEDDDPELLWALKGGGGNFGVVTSFEFDSHPVGPMVFQAAPAYAASDGADVLRKWVAWSRTASDEVTSRAIFWTLPDVEELPEPVRGQDVVIIAALFSGSPEAGEAALAPLREFAIPLADLSATEPYRVAQSGFDPFFAKGAMRSYWKSIYLDDVDETGIDLIVRRAAERPHPLTLIHIPMMGGATGRVAADATAFGDRSAAFMLSVDGNWADAADDVRGIAWVRDMVGEASRLPTARGSYLNFDADAPASKGFGGNVARLTEVKDRLDPGNRFRLNANITPSVQLPGQRETRDATVDIGRSEIHRS
jgi:FAD/FMN-containing dehydrogenase